MSTTNQEKIKVLVDSVNRGQEAIELISRFKPENIACLKKRKKWLKEKNKYLRQLDKMVKQAQSDLETRT